MRRNIVDELELLRLREAEERSSRPTKRSRRHLKRALRKARAQLGRDERNPDARPALDSLDDWILFGPRMH